MNIGPPSFTAIDITRKIKKSTPLKNINFAARRMFLRRGETTETSA
jgi:hypothetical protein